jgi:hypothetical protein
MTSQANEPVSEPLRIVSAGTTLDDHGRSYPTVVVDVSAHPAMVGLARVVAHEGPGDLRTNAAVALDSHGRRSIVLTLTATHPVALEMSIGCPMPAFVGVLSDAARAACLVIAVATGDPPEVDTQGWLAVDLDPVALVELLNWAG